MAKFSVTSAASPHDFHAGFNVVPSENGGFIVSTPPDRWSLGSKTRQFIFTDASSMVDFIRQTYAEATADQPTDDDEHVALDILPDGTVGKVGA